MAEPAKKSISSRLVEYALIIALVFLLTQTFTGWFGKPQEQPSATPQGLSLHATAASYRLGVNPAVIINNPGTLTKSQTFMMWAQYHVCRTVTFYQSDCAEYDAVYEGTVFTPPPTCPSPPVTVARLEGEGSAARVPVVASATGAAAPCVPIAAVQPGHERTVDLAPWKYAIFGKAGTYELTLKTGTGFVAGSGQTLVATLDMTDPGMFTNLFRAFITKPFFNFLVFVGGLLPDHNLGIAIIVLTLLVKLILFYPTQKSLEGQKKMQLLQPKLEAVKKQHKDDPEMMQKETLRLWKEHGVNPFQSCLPLLLQFPVLIGLFYVIRDKSVISTSQHLLYPFYADVSWTFNTMFLWLDLTQPSWIFPPLLIVLQFLQMKLTFHIAKKKKADEKLETDIDRAQQIQQQMMLYLMPLFIGFLAFSFPAAVSLYWGVSTLFAIGQQMIVNREHLKV